MYTIEDFKRRGFCAIVGRAHLFDFLEVCERENLSWATGGLATDPPDSLLQNLTDDTTVVCWRGHDKLMYGTVGEAIAAGYKPHPATSFAFFSESTPEINPDGILEILDGGFYCG